MIVAFATPPPSHIVCRPYRPPGGLEMAEHRGHQTGARSAEGKHLEYQAVRSGEATAVLATFQEAVFFTPATRRRYRQLAECAAFVGVLARGMPLTPMPGIRGGHLSPADPLLSEWDIAVTGPHFASCFTARDLGDSGPDLKRRFEFVLSHNRELAIKAATVLFSRIAQEP